MKEIRFLSSTPLFSGITEEDLPQLLNRIHAVFVNYPKHAVLLKSGDPPSNIGVLISGQVSVTRDDVDGERSLLTQLTRGEVYAETLCCAGVPYSPVEVIADRDSRVLLLNYQRLLGLGMDRSPSHFKLIENMLEILASKNLHLQSRLELLSLKTMRRRIFKYLLRYSKGGRDPFTIPLSRRELAEYLSVDRSALSRELSRMESDGILSYKKNLFRFL